MVAQQHFKARSTDLILASFPKSGTTWLKALLFATVHRKSNANATAPHPLETLSPHQCVPFLESQVYTNNQIPNLDSLPSPRLFSTHIPFGSLPESIVGSNCKIIYICRDPKDNINSWWHYNNKVRFEFDNMEPCPLEETLEFFCSGASIFGSIWDHILGYWKEHLERPHQVLFLTYEGLSQDPVGDLKRLAEFVGCPFSVDEEKEGVLDGILKLCGLENLRSLGVNSMGRTDFLGWEAPNSFFFRRGGVKDWVNHLTPEMARRIDEITESKFEGYGLTL